MATAHEVERKQAYCLAISFQGLIRANSHSKQIIVSHKAKCGQADRCNWKKGKTQQKKNIALSVATGGVVTMHILQLRFKALLILERWY